MAVYEADSGSDANTLNIPVVTFLSFRAGSFEKFMLYFVNFKAYIFSF